MEPVTALTHRFVMHGVGRALHRSHHRDGSVGFEANDAFPVMFAALVMVGLAVGFNVDGWSSLVPVGIGITAYGVSYALVHDVYIHRRVNVPAIGHRRVPGLQHLAAAHRVHHQGNGAPYGMLMPVIGRRKGSRPSQRPDDA